MEDTLSGAARPCQPESNTFPSTYLQAALSLGGGILPYEGCYTPKIWALWLGCDAATVRKYIVKYDIPHIKPGDEMFIEASDMRAAFPKIKRSDERPKRGGSRKKKV
jgi:hypothetical protein